MRRFYKKAEVSGGESGGYAIVLDSRPLHNKMSGTALKLQSKSLAGILASEWQNVPEEFEMSALPVTCFVMGAVALTPEQRKAVINQMLDYARTDTMCFFAPYPDSLLQMQKEKWQPLIDWINQKGCCFQPIQTLSVTALNEKTENYLKTELERLDDISLACVHTLAGTFRSVILGFAVLKGCLKALEAFDLSYMEELFQNQFWTSDAEGVKVREQRRQTALLAETVLERHKEG